MRSQLELDKVKGEIKRIQRHCVKSHYTKDIFCYFTLKYLNIRNVIPTSKLRETQDFLGFV